MSEGYNMRERDGVGGRKVTSQQGDREEKKSEGANGRVQREVRVLYRLSFYSVNTEVDQHTGNSGWYLFLSFRY